MIDEIFEMVMKEARSRPGDDLVVKAFDVVIEIRTRIIRSCNVELKASLNSHSKDVKTH